MLSIIFLAIIQGITEFLPISSSAHLIIIRDIFFIGKDIITSDIELTFDIALHFGTILAIIVYFYKDFLDMIKNKSKILLFIIIATIPGALLGLLLEDIIENIIRNNYLIIIISLILMGIIMYLVDKNKEENKTIETISIIDPLIIGLSQALALIPGFSRSGTTILASRFLKIKRDDSAKFSFYLSVPIVLGAVILKLFKTDSSIIISNINILIIGILISFITGLWCINFLLQYLKNNNLKIFMWYRIILGFLLLSILFF